MFSKIKNCSGVMAAALLFAVCTVAPARAQAGSGTVAGAGITVQTLPVTATSADGLLRLTVTSANPTDAVDVENTFTWTVTNIGPNPLGGVVLGSHWGDACITPNCTTALPEGPTLISIAPGCGGQSAADLPGTFAIFGIWCTPSSGVTLAPSASVSGSVTVRPHTGGPAFYTMYTGHVPTGTGTLTQATLDPAINYRGIVAPAPTDIQITGAASTGSPSAGSTFTYTYQIHNSGPWGTFGGITFTDTLPASLTYVSSSVTQGGIDTTTGQLVAISNANGCSAVGQNVMCPLQDMTVGGITNQATITLTVLASSIPQQIVNEAFAHTNPAVLQGDSNNNNNNVTVTVTSK